MKPNRDAHQEKWIRHFENNRLHRKEPDWDMPLAIGEKSAAPSHGPWPNTSSAMAAGLAN